MKNHPSDIYFCSLRKYYFSSFNLYAFRGTDALQPNSHMVHNTLLSERESVGFKYTAGKDSCIKFCNN